MIAKIDLKIAMRNFIKRKWFSFLNIAGLVLGLTGFILVTLYVNNETSYDQWNKNSKNIYLVELETLTGISPYSPGSLGPAIKQLCPEVEKAGRINTALFEIPFYTEAGRFMVKKWLGADYVIADMLGIKAEKLKIDPKSITPTILLSPNTARVLFPNDKDVQNKTVNMLSKSANPLIISDVAQVAPGNTHLDFDCIGFVQDLTQGKDQSYATQIYQTYIQVKPGVNLDALTKKIDRIYRDGAKKDTSSVARMVLRQSKTAVYLDPLTNLHLQPHYGSNSNYQIVGFLIVLSVIILIIACINFTNLYISQAHKRAKEVALKKINGISRNQIAFQFFVEIFIQCLFAFLVSIILVVLILPYFNSALQINLFLADVNLFIIGQILIALLALTLIAGAYPALIMARYQAINILRGSGLFSAQSNSLIRNGITIFQFTFAIIFIIFLFILNSQVRYMKDGDKGFKADQVIYVNNLGIYNTPGSFQLIRNRIKEIPGVKRVTVASNIPGGIPALSYNYTIQGREMVLSTVGVDYEYFETLNIQLKEGNLFSAEFKDDANNAVINETALKMMDIDNPIGKTIHGCSINYKITGVIKDVKANGFQEKVAPTIYLLNNACGISKINIMFSAESRHIPAILSTLNNKWSDINKLDGESFIYNFLDEFYGKLFAKQEQLRVVLSWFSALAILIASVGLFSTAAYSINIRLKEIAIRKVLGASRLQLIGLLNQPFARTILIAYLIACPVSFFIAKKWLATFAYRIDINPTPFIAAFFIAIFIIAITTCLQAIRAVKENPVIKLKI